MVIKKRDSIESGRTNKSAAALKEIRQRILEEHSNNPELFHPKDIERVRTNDWYVKRFLLARGRKTEAAYQMLRNCLIWRKEMTLPDIKDSDFPLEFYKAGGLFSYEPDLEGNVMIYMRIRMHRKVPELADPMKRWVMHLMDKVDLLTDGQGMAIVFDCTGAGISNADMDFLMFLINSGKNYFPLGAKYILIYELPWILNAFHRMAAAVVPAELMGLVKFANKKNIFELVGKENLPDYMGGTCLRNYRFVPPGCQSVSTLALEYGYNESDVDRIMPIYEPLLKESEEALALKQYTDPPLSEFIVDSPAGQADGQPPGSDYGPDSLQFSSLASLPSDSGDEHLLRLSPSASLVEFFYNPMTQSYEASLAVFNYSPRPVAFKLQSNHPTGYSVTPRFGIILEQGALTIHIRLLPQGPGNCNDFAFRNSRDKFLLLSAPLPVGGAQMTIAQFNHLWSSGPDTGHQGSSYKLSVRVHTDSYKNGHLPQLIAPHHPGPQASGPNEVSQLKSRLERMERRQRQMELLIVVLLVALISLVTLLAYSVVFDSHPLSGLLTVFRPTTRGSDIDRLVPISKMEL